MKKSLLALAVMGAFAGAAQAQVTLYGVVDTGIVSFDDGQERTTAMESGIGGAARWGIKGSEDLGNGLKAQFVLEAGFDSDTGERAATQTSMFTRQSHVGLNGGFGTLRLGRQDTTMKDATGDIDPFGAAGMANSHDFLLGGIDQRRANTVKYLTPNMGGLEGGVTYTFGEVRGENSQDQIFGLRVGYENGPIHAQLAHETLSDENGIGNDQKDTLVGAAYDFGVAKLHAAYATRSVDAGNDIRSGMLGVSAALGNGKVMANYIRIDNRDVDNSDGNAFALGYNYSLSKRTAIVARYVRVSNDDLADFGGAAVAGETTNGIGLGIQHKF